MSLSEKQKIIVQGFGLSNALYIGISPNKGIGVPISIGSGERQILKGIITSRELNTNPGRTSQINYNTPNSLTPDPTIGYSVLNTPVFDTLTFTKASYTDSTYGNITYPVITLDTCLITVTQAHNVIITPIQGRDGEVIEYASKASFRINIKGGIFGTNNQRPKDEIDNLVKMLGSNQPLTVQQCDFLTTFNINQMVVLNKAFPQIAGGYNYQLYEFDCIQDLSVILQQQQLQ